MTVYFITKLSKNIDKQPYLEVFIAHGCGCSCEPRYAESLQEVSLVTALQRQQSYSLGKVNSHAARSELTVSEKSV